MREREREREIRDAGQDLDLVIESTLQMQWLSIHVLVRNFEPGLIAMDGEGNGHGHVHLIVSWF